ncbi:MAG: pitrilysin family protein [Candidatus Gastranaerophilales bacterium]|nr:pitrilysin family protein [Candidatus Gastranaerophilales bacterium]
MIKKFNLHNQIKVVYKKNQSTPRISINLFLNTGIIDEPKAGIASLACRLLMQGTNKRSSQKLADEIDLHGIELSCDSKQDYLKIRATFLNEDIETALDLMNDIVLNSTFEEFEKEVNKIKGEIITDLDSPRTKALDNLIKTLYENHPYGNSHTRILGEIDTITKEEVKEFFLSELCAENVIISVVGDIEEDTIKAYLEKYFGAISQNPAGYRNRKTPVLTESKTVKIAKEDASQAQVIQAWFGPTLINEDFPAFMVLNTLLGAGGLSSRLFLELRDKKGLAYVVRSNIDGMKYASTFSIYIATEPKNIRVALEGFKEEIGKVQNTPVSQEELEGAKNNITGKRAFLHETNSQQSYYLGYYELLGLGAEFDEHLNEKINAITPQDVQNIAKKYLSEKSVISLLAPKDYL